MQATMQQGNRPGTAQMPKRKPGERAPLVRAIGYLGLHKRPVTIAYGALVVATLAQLAVPKLIQTMITSITDGYQANLLLNNPLMRIASGNTPVDVLQAKADNAAPLLLQATAIVVLFAVVRGLFAFVQTYMAEYTSQ